MPQKKEDFEKSLTKLNSIVEKMEQGELSLEQSLKYFEEGVTLIRECQNALTKAEQKVSVLTKQREQEVLKDYDDDEDD